MTVFDIEVFEENKRPIGFSEDCKVERGHVTWASQEEKKKGEGKERIASTNLKKISK